MGCGTSRFNTVDNATSSDLSTDGLSAVQEEQHSFSSEPTWSRSQIRFDVAQPERQVSAYPREASSTSSRQGQHAIAGPSSQIQPQQSSSPPASLARGATDDSSLNSSSSSERRARIDHCSTYFTSKGGETQGNSSDKSSPRTRGTRGSSSAESSPRAGRMRGNSSAKSSPRVAEARGSPPNSLLRGEEKRSKSSSTSSSPRARGAQAGSYDPPQLGGLAQRLAQTDLAGPLEVEQRAVGGGQALSFTREGRPKHKHPSSSKGIASQMNTPVNRAKPSPLPRERRVNPSSNRPSRRSEVDQPLFDGYTSDVGPSTVLHEQIVRYRPVADTSGHKSSVRGTSPSTPRQELPSRGEPRAVLRSSSSSSQDSGNQYASRQLRNTAANDVLRRANLADALNKVR